MKRKVIIFSGAGMSAESGISTFRDAGGLWENYKIEDVATLDAWNANPKLVQLFYNIRRKNIIQSFPNQAHFEIVELEKKFDVTIVTQNIDDLHERAGSSNVLHLHGNIMLAKSSGPKQELRYYPIAGDLDIGRDFCSDGYPLRPHVVWFGESVPNYEVAQQMIQEADALIVIGTSLNVYPAAGLIHETKPNCLCILIDPNSDDLQVPSHFKCIQKNAVEGVKEVKSMILDWLADK